MIKRVSIQRHSAHTEWFFRIGDTPDPGAPEALARHLRELATAVERGDVTAMVIGLTRGQEFQCVYGAGIRTCTKLATHLLKRCQQKRMA